MLHHKAFMETIEILFKIMYNFAVFLPFLFYLNFFLLIRLNIYFQNVHSSKMFLE